MTIVVQLFPGDLSYPPADDPPGAAARRRVGSGGGAHQGARPADLRLDREALQGRPTRLTHCCKVGLKN